MTTYAEWHEQEQELDEKTYEALVDYLDNQHEQETDEYDSDTVSQFRNAYMGHYGWDGLAGFVKQRVMEEGDIPDHIEDYVDWDSLAENEWTHDFWASDNGHVYSSH
jgi:hypothetical protein